MMKAQLQFLRLECQMRSICHNVKYLAIDDMVSLFQRKCEKLHLILEVYIYLTLYLPKP